MIARFYFVDLDFFHKNTCVRLTDELGAYGPLVWLSLCAEAKRSRVKGTVVVTSEPDFWKQLGFYGRDLGFDMDTFLTLTGRLKQTSRTRVGRLLHVVLSHYGDWQNDGSTQAERERKSRYRREKGRDKVGTNASHTAGRTPDREVEVEEDKERPLPLLRAVEDPAERKAAAEAALAEINERLGNTSMTDIGRGVG